jgi:hypothetical protein
MQTRIKVDAQEGFRTIYTAQAKSWWGVWCDLDGGDFSIETAKASIDFHIRYNNPKTTTYIKYP